MRDRGKLWLVYNSASGSNSADALESLRQAFTGAGISIDREFCFPDEPAPSIDDLRQAEVQSLAIFTGDGTISTVLRELAGWNGTVLVLPGGTMNMLSKRLHGEAGADEIVSRLGSPQEQVTRPPVIETAHGVAFTGVTAGPAVAWNDVREALREADVVGVVTSAAGAIGESANGARVRCLDPGCGLPEGYPAITVTPEESGLEVTGYLAETVGHYAGQAVAILQRDFRKGPSEVLGNFAAVSLGGVDGDAMGLLIDGEPFEGAAAESFAVARCDVDLIATVQNG